jgi:kynurenine formamidase
MKTYPGLPAPFMEVTLDYDISRQRYENKAEFYIGSLHLCGNTGTYVDAPIHRYRDGIDLSELPLYRLAHLETVLVDTRDREVREIGADWFEDLDVEGRAVLVRTDWSLRWGNDRYFEPNPYLNADACRLLAQRGAWFVGIDSLNIDNIDESSRPAHTILLAAGIPICEHMTNLANVPSEGGFLHAVPIAWEGGASFPVRAYVVIPA